MRISMAHFLITFGLLFLGFVFGGLIQSVFGKLEGHRFILLGEEAPNTLNFIVETVYLSLIFSIPLSGNLPFFILIVAFFFYALYGGFGREKLKPLKSEDKVVTKWFSGYP